MSKDIKKVVLISGGKDSTLCAVKYLKEYAKDELIFLFCDTGWEAAETYSYLEYLEKRLDISIERIRSEKYQNFEGLVRKKGRFPSNMARFCTTELKVKPTIDWILSRKQDMVIIQGIRQDESSNRANMNSLDDYFSGYFSPIGYTKRGTPKYYKYKKREVISHQEIYLTGVYRPIYRWSKLEVFRYLKKHGVQPNPLYKLGFSRVGCFPCIACSKQELNIIGKYYPERIAEIERMENEYDTTFFPPGYIPEKYCSKLTTSEKKIKNSVIKIDTLFGLVDDNDSKTIDVHKRVPRITDVTSYLGCSHSGTQLDAFNFQKSCSNVLIHCE